LGCRQTRADRLSIRRTQESSLFTVPAALPFKRICLKSDSESSCTRSSGRWPMYGITTSNAYAIRSKDLKCVFSLRNFLAASLKVTVGRSPYSVARRTSSMRCASKRSASARSDVPALS
jgi:hypothetical protein